MKIGIVSHTTIDHIVIKDREKVSIGGPTYYAGIVIRSFNNEVIPITKVGRDFPWLEDKYKIVDSKHVTNLPTTRFKIIINAYTRTLYLLARCMDISNEDLIDLDAYIVSPVIDEVKLETINIIPKYSQFTFLDPQGLVRVVVDKKCYIRRRDLNIEKVDVIKGNEDELYAITGLNGIEALYKLPARISILTSSKYTIMLYNDRLYKIDLKPIVSIDNTGVGDIFAGSYTCSYIKDKDPTWALSVAIAASIKALTSNKVALEKVPSLKDIEDEANELYESIIVR